MVRVISGKNRQVSKVWFVVLAVFATVVALAHHSYYAFAEVALNTVSIADGDITLEYMLDQHRASRPPVLEEAAVMTTGTTTNE